MKLLRSISVLCLLAVGAFANSSDSVKVTLPHAIQVAGNHLAPGDYVIRTLNTGNDTAVLSFESAQGTVAILAMRIPAPPNTGADKTELVFQREGDTLNLDKIWIQNQSYGYAFPAAR
jgi:hypothetical protein